MADMNSIAEESEQSSIIDSKDLAAQLECEKLRREISALDLVWWKRPAYLGIVSPLVIALIGFLAALLSGWFTDNRTALQSEVNALTIQKDTLQESVNLTYRTARSALSDANFIVRNLERANRESHFMLERLKRESGVEDRAIADIKLLYENNEKAAEDALELIREVRVRLDSMPATQLDWKLTF